MSTESTGSTRVSKAVLDEIVVAMHDHDDPGVTIAEVAEAVDGIDHEQAKYRLQKLNKQGRVQKKKIGAAAAVWFPEG